MHSFEVHSNERACRKSGRLGLEQAFMEGNLVVIVGLTPPLLSTDEIPNE